MQGVHRIRQIANVPLLDRPVSGAGVELAVLLRDSDAGDAIVVRRVQGSGTMPTLGVPHLQRPVSSAGHHLRGSTEELQREDSAQVGLLETSNGVKGQQVPDTDRPVLGARDKEVLAFQDQDSVDAARMAKQRLHGREGVEAPDPNGPVLRPRAQHLLGITRIEALDEATVPRQCAYVLQVVHVPDHDVAILRAGEQDVSNGAQARYEASVPSKDVDAMFFRRTLVGRGGRCSTDHAAHVCAAPRRRLRPRR
mmetsp:Transcript_111341/g.311125  ORF Transcript_111341/g.311125 Transcript_111341/m.311125 type:complete len:252 (-) Transcript_111341:843-1598(-)